MSVESTIPRERASIRESTKRRERAICRESTKRRERAKIRESTKQGERASQNESTMRLERATTVESTNVRERVMSPYDVQYTFADRDPEIIKVVAVTRAKALITAIYSMERWPREKQEAVVAVKLQYLSRPVG
jgi:hypothetical protein